MLACAETSSSGTETLRTCVRHQAFCRERLQYETRYAVFMFKVWLTGLVETDA